MTGYIYCHISPSNKAYIGQTTTSLEHRFNNGNNYISSPVFWKAIQKYGWDSFKHIILHIVEAEDKISLLDKLNLLEREEIIKYNSVVPNGYNIELGGGQGRVPKEKSMQISRTSLGDKVPTHEDLNELYVNQRLTLKQVGEKLELSENTISKWLKWYGIPINHEHRKSTLISKEELKKLYINQNLTQQQCADYLKVNPARISQLISEYNLYKRKGQELSYDLLKEYYINQNYTAKKCAEMMNTTYSKVRRSIIRYNLQKGGRGNDKL